MKLAKKNDQALLSFEISGQSRVGHKLRIAHDVRIEVMKPADVAKMTEPLCPTPDVRFLLANGISDHEGNPDLFGFIFV